MCGKSDDHPEGDLAKSGYKPSYIKFSYITLNGRTPPQRNKIMLR